MRGQYAFFRTGKFWREHFRYLDQDKRGLGMFVGKVQTITSPGTLVLLFLKAVIYKRGK